MGRFLSLASLLASPAFLLVSTVLAGHVPGQVLVSADSYRQDVNEDRGDDEMLNANELPCLDDDVNTSKCLQLGNSPENILRVEINTNKEGIDSTVDHINLHTSCRVANEVCISPYVSGNGISPAAEICVPCVDDGQTIFNLTAAFRIALNDTSECVASGWCFRAYMRLGGVSVRLREVDVHVTSGLVAPRSIEISLGGAE